MVKKFTTFPENWGFGGSSKILHATLLSLLKLPPNLQFSGEIGNFFMHYKLPPLVIKALPEDE